MDTEGVTSGLSEDTGETSETPPLVSPAWVRERLDEFATSDPDLRLVEVDMNPAFYEVAHLPGAVGFDWRHDLQADRVRDIPSPSAFADLLGSHGIGPDTTIVVYGDNANWFAAHFYWVASYYGHADVRLLDGGRTYWTEHDMPTTDEVPTYPRVTYPTPTADESIRAYRREVSRALESETALVDVRMPEEYRGDLVAPPGTDEGARRGGHLPGAVNVRWSANVGPDRRFRSREELATMYADAGVGRGEDVITYCRIGERSSVTWFVLSELLGYDAVRNYDGSWAEWGNLVGAPVAVGE
ncbi:sulfurtransferase [Halobaculum sp. MBLA0147]|uniref:sulfurtransferase n=1 Tax=Halobaculum sp. MBLA0147 TaxID=3079934 RepID=UPI0035260EA9